MKKLKTDALGRMVIPIKYRRELGINSDTELEMTVEEEKLIISLSQETCKLCKRMKAENAKIQLCNACIRKVRELDC